MTLPTLTIVIPTYNGRAHLERCLPTVGRHAPPGTQIIVVDDASTDDTAAWIGREYPTVEYLRLETNQGFCRAVNAGIARARGEVIELLNNDTTVSAGWAEAALERFDEPRVGSVAPLVTKMDDPDRIDSAGQDYHICGWATDRRHGQPIAAEDHDSQRVFGASGSCGFYRSEALRKLGGLWPVYGAYFEDTDLAFRLRWAGYECVYEPASRVQHKGTASYGHKSRRQIYLIARNEEIVFWANLPLLTLLLGLLPHLAFQAVRCVRKLLGGGLRPYLAGKLDAILLARTILRRRRETRRLSAARPVDLALTANVRVLRRGVAWLRHRKCA